MQRLVITYFILWPFFFCITSFAQECRTPPCLFALLNISQPDTIRIELLDKLGKYYLDKPGSFKVDIDSAISFFIQALQLSEKPQYDQRKTENLLLLGDCYFDVSDTNKARAYFLQAAEPYHKKGALQEEWNVWMRMSACIPMSSHELLSDKLNASEHQLALSRQLRDTLWEIDLMKTIGDIHLNLGQLDIAEKELQDVARRYKAIHYSKIQYTYDLLGVVNKLQGNLDSALFYNLETIKYAEKEKDTWQNIKFFYGRLGATYHDLHEYEKSLATYRKAIAFDSIANPEAYMSTIVGNLIILGRPLEAIAYVHRLTIKKHFVDINTKLSIAWAFANCYKALKQNEQAEKYYLTMVSLADSLYTFRNTLTTSNYAVYYDAISNFYIESHNYQKADLYLKKLIEIPNGILTPLSLSHLEFMRFKTDSAQGRYLQALDHLESYKTITDSIFSDNKNKQIAEIQVKYETDKKDNDLLLKTKDIQLLTNQTHLQQADMKQNKMVRNAFIGGTLLLLILLSAGYSRYRLKQQKNFQLEIKQKEIFAKNTKLEKLLQENDWLLREVHHRVKNNLQIVMSLLNSQSAFLKDEAALNAMLESRQRVQSMALIHQKLYKSNNASSIYMPEYVRDLVDYLKDSFSITNNIYFDLQIDPIELDVLQAVPMGLILNEVITNAIKYAFPFTNDNRISIHFSRNADSGDLSLIIKDNGCGLPANLNFDNNSSFGMILIRGLAEDLDGTCTITSAKGTTMTLLFNSAGVITRQLV